MNRHERKNISQPAEYWRAWEQRAEAKGVSLSAYIARCVNAELPKSISRRLPDRTSVGQPKKEQSK